MGRYITFICHSICHDLIYRPLRARSRDPIRLDYYRPLEHVNSSTNSNKAISGGFNLNIVTVTYAFYSSLYRIEIKRTA